jgi:RIO-like serine/threonine protein kinase
VEGTGIMDFPACPSHDSNDRTDFVNSDVEVIRTHFKDIRETSDDGMGHDEVYIINYLFLGSVYELGLLIA